MHPRSWLHRPLAGQPDTAFRKHAGTNDEDASFIHPDPTRGGRLQMDNFPGNDGHRARRAMVWVLGALLAAYRAAHRAPA